MKIILLILSLLLAFNVSAKAELSYGVTYLGPSLADDYQSGATYNRYNTGQDFKGDNTDYKSSNQVYQSFSLGYRLSNNYKLSYGFTFQNDLNKGIEYDVYNADGSTFATNERTQGYSANNQRLNLLMTNMYGNKYGFLMANLYYERATTEVSKSQDMNYAIGFQPTIGLYTGITSLIQSLSASFARTYYKNQEFDFSCGTATCHTAYRTFEVSLSYRASYYFSDKLKLNTAVIFDWDKKGNQVNNSSEFNHNMDNIVELGPSYQYDRQLSFGGKLQAALTDPRIDKTALILNFNIRL